MESDVAVRPGLSLSYIMESTIGTSTSLGAGPEPRLISTTNTHGQDTHADQPRLDAPGQADLRYQATTSTCLSTMMTTVAFTATGGLDAIARLLSSSYTRSRWTRTVNNTTVFRQRPRLPFHLHALLDMPSRPPTSRASPSKPCRSIQGTQPRSAGLEPLSNT